jgi:hypothetical protein
MISDSSEMLMSIVSSLLSTLDLLKARDKARLIKNKWIESKDMLSPEFQECAQRAIDSQIGDEIVWNELVELTRKALEPFESKIVAYAIIEKVLENSANSELTASTAKGNYSTMGKLSLAISRLSKVWYYLVKLNLYTQDSYISKAIRKLHKVDLKQAARNNNFLCYILEVQHCFTAHDILRFIEDIDTINDKSDALESNGESIFVSKDLHPELQSYLSQFHTETVEKFRVYTTANQRVNTHQNIMSACDFLTLLKMIFQDSESVKLCLQSDPTETCIFKSITASKYISKEIYKYFDAVLKVDKSLECNQKFNLKMNFEIFLSIFSYMLNSSVLTWCDKDKSLAGVEDSKSPILNAPGINAILDMNLHTKIKKVIESESLLSYKLMSYISDLKMMLDERLKDTEQTVVKEVLSCITTQISSLNIYSKSFNSHKDNYKAIQARRRQLEKIYFATTTNSFFHHYNMQNQIIDLEKYIGLLESLGITKLLPNFTKKNYVVYYMVEASSVGQLKFDGFLEILESIGNKILERHRGLTFSSLLDRLIVNHEQQTAKWQMKEVGQSNQISTVSQNIDKTKEAFTARQISMPKRNISENISAHTRSIM